VGVLRVIQCAQECLGEAEISKSRSRHEVVAFCASRSGSQPTGAAILGAVGLGLRTAARPLDRKNVPERTLYASAAISVRSRSRSSRALGALAERPPTYG
jgi:hypothetical protein